MYSSSFHSRRFPTKSTGFTLVEIMVAISVLALLVALLGQVLSSSTSLVLMNDKHMDADSQARAMLDRLAIDLGRAVKRPDVSYYLKSSSTVQTGNDQLAFFSEVPGYASSGSPVPASPSPISLVGYRVTSQTSVNTITMSAERFGKGLIWNGATGVNTPIQFNQTIMGTWGADLGSDANYEVIAPGVFRFEYYYLLKGQTLSDGTQGPAILSDTPWDTRNLSPMHTSEYGLRDVAAIGIAIAVVDPASRNMISDTQLATLSGQMDDWSPTITLPGQSTKTTAPGDLETLWNSRIATSGLPRPASAAIRVYGRMFYLSTSNQ